MREKIESRIVLKTDILRYFIEIHDLLINVVRWSIYLAHNLVIFVIHLNDAHFSTHMGWNEGILKKIPRLAGGGHTSLLAYFRQ